jgi:hypothetical protein
MSNRNPLLPTQGSAANSPNSVKLKLYLYFNRGPGLAVSSLWTDACYRFWKLTHKGATFADFYAASIERGLRWGVSHKTLGRTKFLAGKLPNGSRDWTHDTHSARGVRQFDMLRVAGLEPHHRCVDYGCGSLRIGQHLIAYLNEGNYCGLDIVDTFYTVGKSLIPEALIEAKSPVFGVINGGGLEKAKAFEPDFIVSIAVMSHVPPAEIGGYLENIVSIMAPSTTVVITLRTGEKTVRSGATSWTYAEGDLAQKLIEIAPHVTADFSDVHAVGSRAQSRKSLLVLRKRSLSGGQELESGERCLITRQDPGARQSNTRSLPPLLNGHGSTPRDRSIA